MNLITAKSILNKKKKTDSWFLDDYTINGYSGCSFNCLYCYIRGSKYGINMAQKVSVKENALVLLEKQLHNRAKKREHGVIVLSSATDPYLQFEKQEQLTRGMLELILKYKFPVHMITKSDLILRDMDLLEKIQHEAIIPPHLPKLKTGTIISFSFTSCDDAVCKIFEPGATPPSVRLNTAQTLVQNNFLVGVSMMPLLPYISDTTVSLNQMFDEFKRVGVKYILPATLTLFGQTNAESRPLVFRAIKKHYAGLFPKYEKLLGHNDYLPPYYHNAFMAKMKEMSHQYAIPLQILP
ncbi:MAG TPA: radical SAM protein [Flavobacteriales bacterium]|nr:radical SAM protein [Flavobacteriales bacterium]